MDDTAQKPKAQEVQPSAETLTDDAKQISSQTKATPAGRAQKETGPVIISEPIITRSDSEQEPILHPEVRNVGVEKVSQEPQLTTEHEKIGITPSFPTPPTELTGKVKLPTDELSEDEAREIVKKGEGSDLEVAKHFEGIYHAPSILGLAIIKLKELSRKLLRQ